MTFEEWKTELERLIYESEMCVSWFEMTKDENSIWLMEQHWKAGTTPESYLEDEIDSANDNKEIE